MEKRKKKWLIFSIVAAVAVVTAVGIGTAWLIAQSRVKASEASASNDGAEEVGKGFFRVLVAGTDRTSGLADVLMLVSFDRDTGEVWILHIPRDTYAVYTEGTYRKLNGAPAALGDMASMKTFMANAMGLSIDRFIRLSPDAFCRCVDALGGVEMELSRAMDYEDPAQGLSIHLSAGKQVLDGAAAEQFVRYRAGYAMGDLDRINAQKIFLAALFQKVRSLRSPTAWLRLASVLRKETETDLTAANAMTLAEEFRAVQAGNVWFVTAPGVAATAKSGASYYALSRDGMARLLEEHFGGQAENFDPEQVFCNPNNETFGEIYRQFLPYRAFSASELTETAGE